MEKENAVILGATIGEVAMVENPRREDMLARSFLRVRVILDLTKPLITSMWTARPNNEPAKIQIRYERLQNFCFKCGILGHDQRACANCKEENEKENNKFGSWLSVQAAKPLKELISCQKEGWEEYEGVERNDEEVEGRLEDGSKEGEEKREYKSDNSKQTQERRKDRLQDKTEVHIDMMGRVEEKREEEKLEDPSVRKGKPQREEQAQTCNGRQGRPKEDMSKAIIPYEGVIPVEEVTKGIGRMNLKRPRNEDEEITPSKKTRGEYNENENNSVPRRKIVAKRSPWKNVRNAKRQGRKYGKGAHRSVEHMDAEKKWNEKETETMVNLLAEGLGDWP